MLLARKVEEAGRWKRGGYRSAADQLAGIAGTSLTAAKNQLETSKKVRKLPATQNALRKGELSAAKAEAIAAAAEIAPEAEAELLDGAQDAPLADIKEKCLRARAQDSDEEVARRMAKASDEMSHWAEYDYIIVNRDIDESVAQVQSVLAAERLRRERQIGLPDFVNRLRQGH